MPSRILRDWTDSRKFDGISAEAERLFVRLLMKADDFGRFHADPRLVRSGCFPLLESVRTEQVDRWLDELSTRRLLFRYEVGGRALLGVVNFRQRLKQSVPKFPPPEGKERNWLPEDADFPEDAGTSGNFQEPPGTSSLLSSLSLVLEAPLPQPPKGADFRELPGTAPAVPTPTAPPRPDGLGCVSPGVKKPPKGPDLAGFAEWWDVYPRKVDKVDAGRAWAKLTAEERREALRGASLFAECYRDADEERRAFIPYPASWLNAKRWLDDPREWRRSAGTKGNGGPPPEAVKRKAAEDALMDRLRDEAEQDIREAREKRIAAGLPV